MRAHDARGSRWPARLATTSVLFAVASCSTVDVDPRAVAVEPDRASFRPVAELLVHSCGTLDCHGTVARNLKVYGNIGLRASPTDRPTSLQQTTDDEVERTFESLVGLEPEILTQVVSENGAAPERLTFVRKARGAESHKGGTLTAVGDDSDTCIVSWLRGTVDTTACARAAARP